MSQDINSIIDQLAEIDSASAKIMKQTQDERINMLNILVTRSRISTLT